MMNVTAIIAAAIATATMAILVIIILRYGFSDAKEGVSLHMQKHPEWYKDAFPEHEFPPSASQASAFRMRVKQGYEEAAKVRVVITGLARDIEKNVGKNISMLERIGAHFADYRILLFENDSKDLTRQVITDMGNVNPRVRLIGCPEAFACLLKMEKVVDEGVISVSRFQKMAGFRNRCLQEIRQFYGDWDYFMPADMDLSGPISIDGLMTSFTHKGWDGMTAMGLVSRPFSGGTSLSYYDSLAYVGYNEPLPDVSILGTLVHTIHTYQKPIPPREAPPERVTSGFAGCAIYRMEVISGPDRVKGADTSYSGNYCEHLNFHLSMAKHGFDRVYINPAFLLLHTITVSKTSNSSMERILFA